MFLQEENSDSSCNNQDQVGKTRVADPGSDWPDPNQIFHSLMHSFTAIAEPNLNYLLKIAFFPSKDSKMMAKDLWKLG